MTRPFRYALAACMTLAVGLAASSGGAAPAASSKIVFLSTRGPGGPTEIALMNADGSARRTLIHPPVADKPPSTPDWSPDGRKIAFVGVDGIYVVNVDGSGVRRLTRNGFVPSWSPSGRKIAYLTGQPCCPNALYVMNADGTGRQRLARGSSGGTPVPAWSPDGRKIAFARERDRNAFAKGLNGNPVVSVINTDGTGLRTLTPNDPFASLPVWSPDGRKIAFSSFRDGRAGIYVMNADGSEQRSLTGGGALGAAAWSPDGRMIAFERNHDVYVINADGTGERRLTRNAARNVSPAWSPDGRKIAFRSTRDGNTEIYVMNPDGTGQRNLTRSPADDGWFAWSPPQK